MLFSTVMDLSLLHILNFMVSTEVDVGLLQEIKCVVSIDVDIRFNNKKKKKNSTRNGPLWNTGCTVCCFPQ